MTQLKEVSWFRLEDSQPTTTEREEIFSKSKKAWGESWMGEFTRSFRVSQSKALREKEGNGSYITR